MKALSVRQPWAWLIARGFKSEEYRSWSTNHRGRLAIHSAYNRLPERRIAELEDRYQIDIPRDELVRSAVVCVVDLIDCQEYEPGQFVFILSGPRAIDPPIAMGGKCHLFDVEVPYGSIARSKSVSEQNW